MWVQVRQRNAPCTETPLIVTAGFLLCCRLKQARFSPQCVLCLVGVAISMKFIDDDHPGRKQVLPPRNPRSTYRPGCFYMSVLC